MESESSKEQDALAIAEVAEELGVTVRCALDEQRHCYVAEALEDEKVVCQGTGITLEVALRNLKRAWIVVDRSRGAAS